MRSHTPNVTMIWNYWPIYYVAWPVIPLLNTIFFFIWLLQMPLEIAWNFIPWIVETLLLFMGTTVVSVIGIISMVAGLFGSVTAAIGVLAVIAILVLVVVLGSGSAAVVALFLILLIGPYVSALSSLAALGGIGYGIYAAVEAGKT